MISGRIQEKGWKSNVAKTGSTAVNFAVKDGDKYHNFVVWLAKGLDVPPYMKPGSKVDVETSGAKDKTSTYNGRTYPKLQVDVSMVKAAGEAVPAWVTDDELKKETALVDEVTKEEMEARFADPEDIEEKLHVLTEFVNIIKDLAPEGQQAIANPGLRHIFGE